MTVKSRLLEILEKEKGETLSGEKLAEELHCTRAAIWKAVKHDRYAYCHVKGESE